MKSTQRTEVRWPHDHLLPTDPHSLERIESIKAGVLAAITTTVVFVAATVINHQVMAATFPELWVLQMQELNGQGLVSGAIALFSGFLFGVTYRYIVRLDDNPHLSSGAVMAFSLVRGLAQVDVGVMANGAIWPFAILGFESFVMFAITRVLLDWGLWLGWIQPFEG